MNCRYSLGRARDGAAEQVGEHQQEQHRRDRHVEQLLGHVLDLEHAAPAEGQARRDSALGRGGRSRRASSAVRCRLGAGRLRRVARWWSAAAHAATPAVVVLGVLGGVAGQRQEHLVEARLAEREAGDRDARRATARRSPPTPASASAHRHRQRGRVGLRWTCAELARAARSASRALIGVEQPHVQRAAADRRLQLRRRALGDHACRGRSRRSARRAGRPPRGTACTAASSCPGRRARG